MKWFITPSSPGSNSLKGQLRPPSSKSQSLRALLFAALADSSSTITDMIDSPDSLAMRQACTQLGACFVEEGGRLHVEPIKELFTDRALLIDAGNSGIVWRFVTAVASHRPALTLLTGDRSLLFRRPMKPLIDALSQVGAHIWQTHPLGGPCVVRGPWQLGLPGRAASDSEGINPLVIEMDGSDSQPVSALLIAAAIQPTVLEIRVHKPREIPWAMLTVRWLRDRGVEVQAADNGSFYRVQGGSLKGVDYEVPGDFSSAAFLIAAALTTRSSLLITGLQREDPQPDSILIASLQKAGAHIQWTAAGLQVDGLVPFSGLDIDLSGPIDLLPVATVLGCYASTPSRLRAISGARTKESDRVTAIVEELSLMGAKLDLHCDELRITPTTLHGSQLKSHRDHRIAMALAVAALGATSPSCISEVEWVAKTYEKFASDLTSVGAKILQQADLDA